MKKKKNGNIPLECVHIFVVQKNDKGRTVFSLFCPDRTNK